MKTLVWVAVLTAFATIAQADEPQKMLTDVVSSSEQVIVINDFEGEIMDEIARDVEWWDCPNGGTSGRLEFSDENPAEGKKCGAFSYDTTYGNPRSFVQTHMRYGLPPGSTELRFKARSAQGGSLLVRLGTKGQAHQYPLQITDANQWKTLRIDLTQKSPQHWGGKNDGMIQQPIGSITFLITAGREPKAGTVWFDQIEVTTTASTAELTDWFWSRKNAKVCLQTGLPGNLYYRGESTKARIVAMPNPPEELSIKVNVRVRTFDSKKAWKFRDLILNKDNEFSIPVRLPKEPGLYYVEMTASDGEHTVDAKSRYAVIPENPALDKYEKESPFGTQVHFQQWWQPRVGQIVKRAGIAWIRHDTGMNEVGLPVAKANKLCYMPVLPWGHSRTPKALKAAKDAGKVLDETWDFSKEVELHRKYAERYGKDIDVYDLINEPHIPWGPALGGNWLGGEWQKMFSILVGRISDAIKQADPGAKVLWEDGDQLAWYKNWVDLGVADKIDYISPHTYNLHRSSPLPEEQFVVDKKRGQFPEFRKFCKENNLPWKVWAGEVGFSTFTIGTKANGQQTNHYYTPCTEIEQAQNLVRMMVYQLYSGMEKIFWYDFQDDGWDPHNQEHNFGIVLNNFLPKPAVVAYANLISRLRGTTWLGEYALGTEGCEAMAFSRPDGANPTLVCWKRSGTAAETVQIHSGISDVTVTDIYGRSRCVEIKDKILKLELSPSPVYIEDLKMSDLKPHLTKRDW